MGGGRAAWPRCHPPHSPDPHVFVAAQYPGQRGFELGGRAAGHILLGEGGQFCPWAEQLEQLEPRLRLDLGGLSWGPVLLDACKLAGRKSQP